MGSPGESKTSPRRLLGWERQRQALELRKAGASYDSIAKELGYRDRSGAYRAVAVALLKTLQEPAAEVRQLELERLDKMLLGLWRPATSGHEGAVDRVLRIMARRAALLGLDAPVRADVTTGGEPMAPK